MKVLIAQLNYIIGDLQGNTQKMIHAMNLAREQGVDIILFSELSICGYFPEDLLLLPHFIDSIEKQLKLLIEASENLIAIVGLPRKNPDHTEKPLFNSAAIIQNRHLIGFQDKSLLPTYDVFDERRYFEPSHSNSIWKLKGKKVAITICEDIWEHSEILRYTSYRRDPILDFIQEKPDFILNLSASPFSISKFQHRLHVCKKASTTLQCPLLLCNQVGGNDSLIFDGYSLYVEGEQLISCAKGFQEDNFLIDLSIPPQEIELTFNPIQELYRALILGLRDYFKKSGFSKACLGISGGIDSAVVACIAVEALEADNVLGVLMPSRFTTEQSIIDGHQLIKILGINATTISIEKPFQSYLNLLESQFEGKAFDVTEENLQARIRGMILMAISNKLGYLVLSTGNKSELALGYATLYGDMCGGLAVINDVTKMHVYALAKWINRNQEIIPWNIISKPPSAELRPNQKDQDSLPEYPIVDNVLKAYVEEFLSPEEIAEKFHYPIDLILDLVHRIHRNEYKRRQSAPGLRVSEKAFSIGRRFPIVEKWTLQDFKAK